MTIAKQEIGVSFKNPTPTWATWVFRIVFWVTTAATFVIAADPDISDKTKVKIGVYLKGFDFVIWGIAQGIGVKKKDFQPEEE